MEQQLGGESTNGGQCCINVVCHRWRALRGGLYHRRTWKLTPRQKILFREPADPYRHFPSLFEGVESEGI